MPGKEGRGQLVKTKQTAFWETIVSRNTTPEVCDRCKCTNFPFVFFLNSNYLKPGEETHRQSVVLFSIESIIRGTRTRE